MYRASLAGCCLTLWFVSSGASAAGPLPPPALEYYIPYFLVSSTRYLVAAPDRSDVSNAFCAQHGGGPTEGGIIGGPSISDGGPGHFYIDAVPFLANNPTTISFYNICADGSGIGLLIYYIYQPPYTPKFHFKTKGDAMGVRG